MCVCHVGLHEKWATREEDRSSGKWKREAQTIFSFSNLSAQILMLKPTHWASPVPVGQTDESLLCPFQLLKLVLPLIALYSTGILYKNK